MFFNVRECEIFETISNHEMTVWSHYSRENDDWERRREDKIHQSNLIIYLFISNSWTIAIAYTLKLVERQMPSSRNKP